VSLAIPLGVTGRRAVVQLFVGDDIRADAENVVFFELLRSSIAGILAQVAWNALERGQASARAELDQAKIAFFSNVSHEFRTPLTLLLGLIEEELAEDDQPLPPGRHARLETARRNGIRLLRMVNTLLDFWHIEAGRMDAAFEPVDLAAVTEDVATGFRAAIEKLGLRLSTRLETLPEPVYVDRDM
jgi:signal transduction histidine kinase